MDQRRTASKVGNRKRNHAPPKRRSNVSDMQAANKTLAGWMAASVLGAGVLVGGAKLGSDDKPNARTGNVASKLKECDLGEGRKGLIYDGVCLNNPPFGWVSGSESTDSNP